MVIGLDVQWMNRHDEVRTCIWTMWSTHVTATPGSNLLTLNRPYPPYAQRSSRYDISANLCLYPARFPYTELSPRFLRESSSLFDKVLVQWLCFEFPRKTIFDQRACNANCPQDLTSNFFVSRSSITTSYLSSNKPGAPCPPKLPHGHSPRRNHPPSHYPRPFRKLKKNLGGHLPRISGFQTRWSITDGGRARK